jgi:hypothetical protein
VMPVAGMTQKTPHQNQTHPMQNPHTTRTASPPTTHPQAQI